MKITSIVQLFGSAVGFTILMLAFRVFYAGNLMYLFLVWNLFLATVPLGISMLLLHTKRNYSQWMLYIVWLLFFPNALYLITDLVHLKTRYPVPLWFDTMLIFSAAINGLVIAFVSLHQIEIFLRSKFRIRNSNIILVMCLFLASFGIYLGRYLRWNSWGILTDPFGLVSQVIDRFSNPFEHPRTWGMTIVFTIFFSIFYFAIKKLITVSKQVHYETTLV